MSFIINSLVKNMNFGQSPHFQYDNFISFQPTGKLYTLFD